MARIKKKVGRALTSGRAPWLDVPRVPGGQPGGGRWRGADGGGFFDPDPEYSDLPGGEGIEANHLADIDAELGRLELAMISHVQRDEDLSRNDRARELIKRQRNLHKARRELRRQQTALLRLDDDDGKRDLVIVGAGPAGLQAAVSGSTETLDTLLVEAGPVPGGQAKFSTRIDNSRSYPYGVTGRKLAADGELSAERNGADIAYNTRASGLEYDEATGEKIVHFEDGRSVRARGVIISAGMRFTELKVPGLEAENAVYGDTYKILSQTNPGEHVAILGGANSAGQAALTAANEGRFVTMVVRSNLEKSMSGYLLRQIKMEDFKLIKELRNHPRIRVLEGAEIQEAQKGGDGRINSIILKDGSRLPASVVGVFIGAAPNTEWTGLDTDDKGFILPGPDARHPFETSMPGVFAVGQNRAGGAGRIEAAGGEGSAAVEGIYRMLPKRTD